MTENPETPSDVRCLQQRLEETLNSACPTAVSPTTVTPRLLSISATPGFSAFTRVQKELVYERSEPSEASCITLSHKAS